MIQVITGRYFLFITFLSFADNAPIHRETDSSSFAGYDETSLNFHYLLLGSFGENY